MTAPTHSDAPVWSPDGATAAVAGDTAESTEGDAGVPETAPVGPGSVTPAPAAAAPAGAPAGAARRRSQAGAAMRLLAVGAIVAVAGLGFAIGRVSAPAASSGTGSQAGAGALGPGGNGGFAPGGSFDPGAGPGDGRGFGGLGGGSATIEGTVESVGDGTMTVKLANGSTVTIATNSSTAYHGQEAASQSDVATGQTVTVQVTTGTGATASGAAASAATASGVPAITRTATDVTITGR